MGDLSMESGVELNTEIICNGIKHAGNKHEDAVTLTVTESPTEQITSYTNFLSGHRFHHVLNHAKLILISAVPYLTFLIVYRLNTVLHILPTYEDKDHIYLYNISEMEYAVLHFHPHKIISSCTHFLLDLLATGAYMMHFMLPFIFPLYLLIKGQHEDITKFYWLFGCFLWLQFFIWYIFPTAPPWYYDNLEEYSSMATVPPTAEQHREGCLFKRMDIFFETDHFFKMYKKGSVPFGAFPSGHVAWPTCIGLIKAPGGKIFWIYIFIISWATMYTCHHFLSDVLGAIFLVYLVKRVIIYVNEKDLGDNSWLGKLRNILCPFNVV